MVQKKRPESIKVETGRGIGCASSEDDTVRYEFIGFPIFADPLFDAARKARKMFGTEFQVELLLEIIPASRGERFKAALLEILAYPEVEGIKDESVARAIDHPADLDGGRWVDYHPASLIECFFHRKRVVQE